MTKLQYTVVGSAVVLLLILYFGFDTKAPKQRQIEQSRALVAESTDINALLRDAKSALEPAQRLALEELEQQLASAPDTAGIAMLKTLSGRWMDYEQPAIAGYYAQQVAERAGDEEAWSIAATTYAICVQRSSDERIRDFCTQRAVSAFESAISLAPDKVANRVNLALVYTENPPADNPMRGITLLRELEQRYPDNALVLKSLGRLAIRTNQYDRAVERLEKALSLAPDDNGIICLLAQAYEGAGNAAKAADFAADCRQNATPAQ